MMCHGAKSARTDWMSFEMPTKEEFQQKRRQNNEEIKADLSKAMKEAKELQQEVKALSDKLMQKKT